MPKFKRDAMNGLSFREWQLLRSAYSSTSSYKTRSCGFSSISASVGDSRVAFNSLKDWIGQKGGKVVQHYQHEILRFVLNGKIAVIYANGSASLWGHEYAHQFFEEQPDCGCAENAYMGSNTSRLESMRSALKELSA